MFAILIVVVAMYAMFWQALEGSNIHDNDKRRVYQRFFRSFLFTVLGFIVGNVVFNLA